MKQLILNLALVLIIGIGGVNLTEAEPVSTESTITSQNFSMLAECEEDGKTVSGDRCAIINGHCTCWDE